MNVLLVGLSTDPRAGLAAGFEDAGQALMNMELLASLPKPPGFFDPNNPAGLPASRLQENKDNAGGGEAGEKEKEGKGDEEDKDDKKDKDDKRYPLLSFSNTDIAFRGDVMVTGS